MEDSVGEEERREQGETVAQPKAHQEEAAAAGGVDGSEPAQDGGFLIAMASKIGATMSGANGRGGEAEANAAAASDGEALNGEPGEEAGFLSSMVSKIGAAMSGADGGGESNGGGNAAVAPDDEGREKDECNGGDGFFHKLLSSSPLASSPASEPSGTLEAEGSKEDEKDRGVADEQSGILSTLASKIGMAMSAANGNENHGTEQVTKTSNGHTVDASSGEEEEGDPNGGGILNTMASKISMAMTGANGDDDHGGSGVNGKTGNGNAVDGSEDEEKKGEATGGGILSAVTSNIGMTVSGANGNGGNHSTEDDAKTSNGDAGRGRKDEKKKGHDANGAGIVDQIISNLPSDDQALDSEEASMLIAIIED